MPGFEHRRMSQNGKVGSFEQVRAIRTEFKLTSLDIITATRYHLARQIGGNGEDWKAIVYFSRNLSRWATL